MRSSQRFSKKWKWVLIGSTCSLVTAAGLSLGIALASQNKSLQVSSPYFVGQKSVSLMYQNLADKGYTDFQVNNWENFAKDFSINYVTSSNLSSALTNTQFGTYQINSSSLDDLTKQDLLSETKSNLSSLLDNEKLDMNYYTLDSASFFSSSINLFTDGVINSLSSATNDLVNLELVSRSTTTATAVYDDQNCELGSSFWSPDYSSVSAWIGYLFAQNSGWITGNLWPCLWALLAGANPTNGTFVYNDTSLPNWNYKYSNASTFAQQLAWTNERRAAMGLGDLPNWAVSLYYTLYNYFGDSIAWNTPYGWWQLQYNNNNLDGSLQYLIQNWVSSIENSAVTISINSSSYTGNYATDPSPSSYDNSDSSISIDNSGKIQYTSQSSLIPFIAWIDALTPTMPFYSEGNNFSSTPVLTQKGIYPLLNPANAYINSSYFINLSGNSYSKANPFTYYIPTNVVSTLNYGYFSPVIGSNAFYEWSAGLYSGFLDYAPYNWSPSTSDDSSSYSAGWGVTDKSSSKILKIVDATNFELLSFTDTKNKFVGAHYIDNGKSIDSGDTIVTSGNDQNANVLFVADPSSEFLSEQQFEDLKDVTTWSTYTDYVNFMKYHEVTLTDPNLISAMNNSSAYQFTLNKNVKWVNEEGDGVWSIEPDDFNNSLVWMAATMSDYSYDSSGESLGQVQSNSYMLQEIGIAGNNFNLGVGSGFFQTEEYAANKSNSGDTFTYFLSPSSISSSSGWSGGSPVSYFLSMLGYQGEYFDPMPSEAKAFHDLPSSYDSSGWQNLTLGDLTSDFMGTSSTTGVWNLSNLLGENIGTSSYNQLFDSINSNPAYVSLVADENLSSGYSSLYYLYGSGLNPASGLPDMQSDLYFNGGYYATPGSFTNSSLETKIYAPFFDTAEATDIDNTTYYIFGPSRQKVNYVKYEWSANITKEEELVLFTSNQISVDSNITTEELDTVSLDSHQAVYFKGVNNVSGINWVAYNAQIYDLTSSNATGNFDVPMNASGNPLITLDITDNSVVDDDETNGQTYYGRYGFPYITSSGDVLYTNSNETTGLLKSYVSSSWTKVVGTALNPFIFGTTGAEIRQDIDALINWSAIGANASYPLPQSTVISSIIPYGNYKGTFEYESVNGEVTVSTFYQYAAATSGLGILGSPLYFTYKDNGYYEYNDWSDSGMSTPGTNGNYYSYTLYQWDLINAINDWN